MKQHLLSQLVDMGPLTILLGNAFFVLRRQPVEFIVFVALACFGKTTGEDAKPLVVGRDPTIYVRNFAVTCPAGQGLSAR